MAGRRLWGRFLPPVGGHVGDAPPLGGVQPGGQDFEEDAPRERRAVVVVAGRSGGRAAAPLLVVDVFAFAKLHCCFTRGRRA
jgi:hypothetical protein